MDSIKWKYLELARSDGYDVCIWGAGFLGTQKGMELLCKYGILVDYYCDNNQKLWGKEVIKGIRCISPVELQEKKERVICFLFLASAKVAPVLRQIYDMGIEKIILFDELFEEEKFEYFPFMKKRQIVIYTCIVGGYDDLREPLLISPECDYFVVSDKKPEKKTMFEYIDINQYLPHNITDDTKKNRFCKINAHKIFPQYKYSIYFDGILQINSKMIMEHIERLPKTRIITMCNNYWEGPYMEAMRVILNERDSEEIVKEQIEKYWLEGMPENYGSMFCGILLREHNNPICRKIMEDWWGEVEQFSRRDMISFPYVIWKNGYVISDVKTLMTHYAQECMYWKIAEKHNRPRLVYRGREVY